MEKISQFPLAFWRETKLPAFDKLNEDITVDVAIVGGGITGITAAYLLSKEGLKVAVLEAGSILNGTTGHTTAKITAQHGLIYDELIHHIGEEKAKLYYKSHAEGLEFIRSLVLEQGIECDFSNEDAFIYASTDEYAEKIEQEWKAYQTLGIEGSLCESIPFPIDIKNALRMNHQAQFHPLKYLAGLLDSALHSGCAVYENTTAMDVEDADSDEPKVVTRDGHSISCRHVISASHFPFYDGMGFYFARMHQERSYVIGVKTEKEFPGGMYISVDNPTRSIRSTPVEGGNLVIIGGENHKTGQGPDTFVHYEALQDFAYHVLGTSEISYRWSAQDLITLDKIPYIGPVTKKKENILIATGYKKWGMTGGTLAARLLCDYVLKQENPYKEIYTPSRFDADPSFKNLVSTNADVATHLIKGKLEFVPKDPDDVQNGQGCVVMYNGKRSGAYRDDSGHLFMVDTTCTHLGCECEWNHAEKTWDCPCHGSRFSYKGDVVDGPALDPLKVLGEE
ncbi:MAG: FAD-dependent oxidoreductase [Bacillota bacterium]|nr:FAD-dependent oxidoreductase [Bacillota bacterium]